MKSGYGNRIKDIREKSGLSRGDFGEKLGLSYDQILKIESENRKPSDEVKVKISEEFGVSTDYILKGSEFVMPRLPSNMNMNLHTIMAKKAIDELKKVNVCTETIAKSIQSLDCAAIVGMEYLERERNKFDTNPEVEKMIKLVRMEGRVAN